MGRGAAASRAGSPTTTVATTVTTLDRGIVVALADLACTAAMAWPRSTDGEGWHGLGAPMG